MLPETSGTKAARRKTEKRSAQPERIFPLAQTACTIHSRDRFLDLRSVMGSLDGTNLSESLGREPSGIDCTSGTKGFPMETASPEHESALADLVSLWQHRRSAGEASAP